MSARKTLTVFIAMPFRATYDPVLETVKEAASLLNMKVVQVGEEPFAGSIISHIRASIQAADLMLAIVTEENGNVYYEIGLAHCQQKPVVLLTSDAKTLKFDLRDHRAIVYDPKHPQGIRDDLVRTFKAALDISTDPRDYLANTFGGTSSNPDVAYHRGLEKAVKTVTFEASLQEPVTVKQLRMLQSGALAIEVEDFMRVCVRAVLDINGIITNLKRMNGA